MTWATETRLTFVSLFMLLFFNAVLYAYTDPERTAVIYEYEEATQTSTFVFCVTNI